MSMTRPGRSSVAREARKRTSLAVAGAAACVACCAFPLVLPFAVSSVALAGLGSVLALFAREWRWLAGAGVVACGFGWYLLLRKRMRTGRAPSAATRYAMVVATTALVLTLVWRLA